MPEVTRPPRVLIVVNVEWYFISHRLSLAGALRESGFDVTVAAAVERDMQAAVEQAGFRFVRLNLRRRSTSPLQEWRSFRELSRLYRALKPDLVHHITIKPVLYGSIAAKLARVGAVVNTVPGLGYMFIATDFRSRVRRAAVTLAYRVACAGRNVRVILQNPDDLRYFLEHRVTDRGRASLIRGSGVDVGEFSPAAPPGGVPIVMLASRLVWDKGIAEFVEAARILRERGVPARFVLVGVPDTENPNAVSEDSLKAWHSQGLVEWWGLRDDMPAVLRQASVVALPTAYPEGVPRILIEAAASGLPIVASDAPGCREVVREGVNGLLVPAKIPEALADAIGKLLALPELRAEMGARGREIAVRDFAEQVVIRQTMAVYRDALGELWQADL